MAKSLPTTTTKQLFQSAVSSNAINSPSSTNSTEDVDDLLTEHLDTFGQFKDTSLCEEYDKFNKMRTSTVSIFLFALFVSVAGFPFIFITMAFVLSEDKNFTATDRKYAVINVGLLGFALSLFWLLYYVQKASRMKPQEQPYWYKYIGPYKSTLQFMVYIAFVGSHIFRFFARIFRGQCEESYTVLAQITCNPLADSHSLPIDSIFSIFMIPVCTLVFKDNSIKTSGLVWFCSVASIGVGVYYVKAVTVMPALVFYTLFMPMLYFDMRRQSLILFFLNHKLANILVMRERNADEMHANEMRSMIANVAHDLKTPLASFLSGIEFISQVLSELKHNIDKKKSLMASDAEEFIHTIANCVGNIKSINSFMLMTINRCIDYTKASKGLKLVPKYETIELYETLMLPLNCMSDIQSRVIISLNEIPEEICSHVITDKQWLQENVLCLLSNAVKYSSEGEVTINISLRKPNGSEKRLVQRMRSYFGMTYSKDAQVHPVQELDHHHVSDNHTEATIEETTFVRNFHDHPDPSHVESDAVAVQSPPIAEEVTADAKSLETKTRQTATRRSFQADAYLVIEIEDRGIGISEEVMAGLFSPFKQAQRLAGGTGLGLYSLMKRVEALNGFCGVRGRKDGEKGSLFWFEIPYRPDRISASLQKRAHKVYQRLSITSLKKPIQVHTTEAIHPNHSSSPALSRNSSEILFSKLDGIMGTPEDVKNSNTHQSSNNEKKIHEPNRRSFQGLDILLVEDSPSIMKMTTMMLKRHGHLITCAENGEEALKQVSEKIKRTSKIFDVILMDLQMPVMDGLEAARRLRLSESTLEGDDDQHVTNTPKAKKTSNPHPASSNPIAGFRHIVIGVSANSDHDTTEAAYSVGFDAFISKPFSIDTFYETYERLKLASSSWSEK